MIGEKITKIWCSNWSNLIASLIW